MNNRKPLFLIFIITIFMLGGCSRLGDSSQTSTSSPSSGVSPSSSFSPGSSLPTSASKPQKKDSSAPVSTVPSTNAPAASQGNQPTSSTSSPISDAGEPLTPENAKIVSQLTEKIKEKSGLATQNSGLITMNRVLLAQQAQWLISGTFTKSLKALEPNLPSETTEYRFGMIAADRYHSVMVAVAKNEKLPSYSGATFAVPAGLPEIGMCQSKLPSTKAPSAPKIVGGQVICGNDGVLVNKY